jgi:hypothetical protein
MKNLQVKEYILNVLDNKTVELILHEHCLKLKDPYTIGIEYANGFINAGADREDVKTDMGESFVQEDLILEMGLQNIDIDCDFIVDNFSEIEEGLNNRLDEYYNNIES